jgi:hypothetical protein
MKSKLIVATASAVMTVLLLGATSASAATEAGSRCVAESIEARNETQINLVNAPGSPLPAAIPVNGVITRWTFNVVPIPAGTQTQTLKVFRPTSTPNEFQVIGESAPGDLGSGGLSSFSTRIPVRAGDFIGNSGIDGGGEPSTISCVAAEGQRVGSFEGNPPVNSNVRLEHAGPYAQVPITVSVEPDADSDGFGDETQDACPQSAAFQTACPPLVLSALGQAKMSGVTVFATTGTTSPVSVKGVVKLGKGKKATLNGGTKTLIPGFFGKFTLKFSKGLKGKLKELSRKKSLNLNVTVSGTNLSGAVTTKTLKLKLKGQAKP